MAESFFESEVALEAGGGEAPPEAQAEPAALAVSTDDFAALEERVRRAVELVKQERQARTAAEERAADAEAKLQAQARTTEQLENELRALRGERDQVRQRVDRVLKQLDALEL